jgi:hypothetical protein
MVMIGDHLGLAVAPVLESGVLEIEEHRLPPDMESRPFNNPCTSTVVLFLLALAGGLTARERVEVAVVSVGRGLQVLLRGLDLGVAHAFHDGLEIFAADKASDHRSDDLLIRHSWPPQRGRVWRVTSSIVLVCSKVNSSPDRQAHAR